MFAALIHQYRSCFVLSHLAMPSPPPTLSWPGVPQKDGHEELRNVLSVQLPRTNSVAPGFLSSSPVAWQMPLERHAYPVPQQTELAVLSVQGTSPGAGVPSG